MYKIKRTLQPYIVDNQIVFGFGNLDLEQKIEYTKETEKFLVRLDEGIDHIDSLSKNERKILDSLISKGLITDNLYDNGKYSRNINFFEWIDTSSNLSPSLYQEKLNASTILILGLGGIGGTVSEILARTGIGKLILVDYDIVDESNLTRQSTYSISDIGKTKIAAIDKYLHKISDIDIIAAHRKIDVKEDLMSLFNEFDFDLAVCCADKPKIKIDYWFDEVAHIYNKPFIIGSYASTVINRACIVPNETITLTNFYGEYMASDNHLLSSEVPTSIIAPISFMSAGMIAYKVVNFITQLNDMKEAVQIDILDWQVSKYDLSL